MRVRITLAEAGRRLERARSLVASAQDTLAAGDYRRTADLVLAALREVPLHRMRPQGLVAGPGTMQ